MKDESREWKEQKNDFWSDQTGVSTRFLQLKKRKLLSL